MTESSIPAKPVVHYVRDSSRGPDYPRLCRNAIATSAVNLDDSLSMAVFGKEGLRFKIMVPRDTAADPGGGTWHHIADCPRLAPPREAPETLQPDPARQIILQLLYRPGGPMTVRDIAVHGRLAWVTVIRALSQMEADGLVRHRKPGSEDTRWELTSAGAQQAARAWRPDSMPAGQEEARQEEAAPGTARQAILRQLALTEQRGFAPWMTVQDIAVMTRLTRDTAQEELTLMLQDGLIAGSSHPGPGRRYSLTAEGRSRAAGENDARGDSAPLYLLIARVPPGREASACVVLHEAGFTVYRAWRPDSRDSTPIKQEET